MDRQKYDIIPIGITKEGKWVTGDLDFLLSKGEKMILGEDPFHFSPDATRNNQLDIDVIFPVMHGTMAEDGIIQGLFELANLPYVGCNVSSSVLAFDKALTKIIASSIGLEQADYLIIEKHSYLDRIKEADDRLGYPCFVKPARQGSSVGISKVFNKEQLEEAIIKAFSYDNKVVVEEFIEGREIEISILGNEDPQASLPGEIIPGAEFYDYEAKYASGSSSILNIPAKLSSLQVEEVRQLAIRLYKALGCRGLARVDFFLTKDKEKFYINEINTIPGFTSISMYPKLWEASGLPFSRLIDKIISLALENK